MDVNCIVVSGYLGADPDMRYSLDGKAILSFNLANHCTKDDTNWFRVVCFGKLASLGYEYLARGSHATVSGKLKQRTWEDKEQKRHRSYEIIANELYFAGRNNNPPQPANSPKTVTPF